MYKSFFLPLMLSACFLGIGCAAPVTQDSSVFQSAPIDRLLAGRFDGDLTIGELRKQGDLGLGTFQGLDGEMILVDGQVYQATWDGNAHPVADSQHSPFAEAVWFRPTTTGKLAKIDSFEAFSRQMDSHLDAQGGIVVVRIDGDFDYVKTRSIPRQSPPYPTMLEAAKGQVVTEHSRVQGTLVGFRYPQLGVLNVPGWHLHFISHDRRFGGHVLDLRADGLEYRAAVVRQVRLTLPKGQDLPPAGSPSASLRDLEKIEK